MERGVFSVVEILFPRGKEGAYGPNGLTEMLAPLKAARQAATKCTTPPAEVTHYIAF